MKIVLLYGPGEVGKRNESLRIRRTFDKLVKIIDLKQVDPSVLATELLSNSLFETGPRLVVAENAAESLDLEKLGGEENVTLLVLASNLKSDSTLIKSAQKLKAKLVPFEGEKEVSAFPFLDALIEGKKTAFLELNKLLNEYNGVYVLTMIYYLLRRNFLPQSSLFMQKKVGSQVQKYSEEDWPKMYRLVLEADASLKSGLGSEEVILTNLVQVISSKSFAK